MLDCLEEGANLDAIYLEYAEAFDKCDHSILKLKLEKAGIKDKLKEWLHSFVTGRKQKIKVENKYIEEADIVSGVPEGTVLGPLLFLIFINYIDEDLDNETTIGLFADNTRVEDEFE